MTTNTNLIELGEIKIGIPHTFNYTLSAMSDLIKITSLNAGCRNCTVASTKRMTIDPNESMSLDVVFTPKDMGFQTKMIHINYEENGSTLKTTLKFTATVVK